MSEQPYDEKQAQEDVLRLISGLNIRGGVWQPGDYGLTYVRDGERSLLLTSQENTPMAAQFRIRLGLLIESVGWTVDDSECMLVDIDSQSPQERHMEEMMQRQEMAQSWECQCGTPLSAFPLEDASWNHDGQDEMMLPTGEAEMVERWSVSIDCPVCEAQVPMDPYDFGILAGDDLLSTYRTPHMVYEALDRGTIVNRVDEKETSHMMVLGTFCPINGDLLPPHVRGGVVWATPRTEEE